MAQVTVEALDTRSLSDSGGRLVGTRSFYVYDDTTPMVEPSSMQFGTGGMPDYGESFPGEPEVFATSFSIEAVPNSNYVWRITWQYMAGGGGEIIAPIDVQPMSPGYVTISLEYGGEFRDAWRADPGLTLWSPFYTGTDIGGTKIDAAGEPTSVFVPMQMLIVEETVTSGSMASRSINIRLQTGTRNSSAFYGAQVGTLLYEGASARRVSLTAYSVTHRFRYDEWLHARQQPRMNQQRQPDVDIYAGIIQANSVRWVQPFPNHSNFNALSENF